MKYEFKSIGEMFEKYKIIHVPYYQRDYVWGTKNSGRNLYKFIDDIFTQYQTNPESDYFIGTLAFCSERTNDVIDGQQRITSIILILSLLSKLKCSQNIIERNNDLLMGNGTFVIQEEDYLTEELKFNLRIDTKFSYAQYNVHIDKTVEKIEAQIKNDWDGYSENWYDSLYNYILEHVKFISLEYSNIGESLKYFLNINSLSIQLTQSDIFYSILSQSLKICNNINSIFTIKENISSLAEGKGLDREIEGYKAYDDNKKSIDNIIYIFLNAYFQKDKNIMYLNETGIGKWLSFYKNEVFQDQLIAKEFTDKFIQYLVDFEYIYNSFTNNSNYNVPCNSSRYTSWIMLQYEKYFDILKMLQELFKNRHNYFDGGLNLYKSNSNLIDNEQIEEVAKRLNLTLILNYIRNSNKRLDGFITNISLDNGIYKRSIDDIKVDIAYDYIFTLNYNDGKAKSNSKIKDESRQIKLIFAYQESLLNSVVNESKDFNNYLEDILLSEKFSIEHLYSVNEFDDKDRLNRWRQNKKMFDREEDFDSARFSFENLSLLDSSSNSSANDKEITEKLQIYRNAKKVCNTEYEYLIMSLVEYSEYYNNENIKKLNLPNRAIQNINLNTWDQSENNREFNIEVLKLAVEKIANR